MRPLKQFIVEATNSTPYKSAKTYGDFGEKWFDMCKDFATAGNTRYMKHHFNEFSDFTKEMDAWFTPPASNNYYDKLCKARWEMCKALKTKNLDKFIEIAKDNKVNKLSYGASYEADKIYGSFFLDVYMLISTYNYIAGNKVFMFSKILNSLWNIESDLSQDWYDVYIERVNKLKQQADSQK